MKSIYKRSKSDSVAGVIRIFLHDDKINENDTRYYVVTSH